MKTKVKITDIDKEVFSQFDYSFDGESEFKEHAMPSIKDDFNLGVIVGSSGSGKSTLLKQFGVEKEIVWDNAKSIISHFESPNDAITKLSAVGLNSIPTWGKPRNVLSTGEGFRADMARKLDHNIVIDEFTSVVNRETAKSLSVAFSKYIKKNNIKNVVLASCHSDILDWLEPDWVYNTDNKEISRGLLRRPNIVLEMLPCTYKAWALFSRHHYLTEDINISSRCWIATWMGTPIGFISIIAFPNGAFKNGWREHRTVVLPDFQGMGIGVRLSDSIGEFLTQQGYRFFSKTVHPRMGEYRESKEFWKPTQYNKKTRHDKESSKVKWSCRKVASYCHEYIGINKSDGS